METIINIWKCRKMSLKGKILILISLVLPQKNYLLSVCFCPMHILKIDYYLNSYGKISSILSFEEFFTKANLNIDILLYNKIIDSIPRTGNAVKQISNIIRSVTPLIPVRGKLTEICNLKNMVLYWTTLNDKLQVPSSVERWIEIFPFIEVATWGKMFHMVHYIVKESLL